MDPQRVGEERVALQDPAEEFELEIELALFAEPSSRGLGSRALGGRVAWSILGCGHRDDAPFPAKDPRSRHDAPSHIARDAHGRTDGCRNDH